MDTQIQDPVNGGHSSTGPLADLTYNSARTDGTSTGLSIGGEASSEYR